LAPEVLIALDTGKGYGEEVDMFGVGVITYILYVAALSNSYHARSLTRSLTD